MRLRNLILLCAALVPLATGAGCTTGPRAAAAAPRQQWVRDTVLDPWRPLGVSPTARWIEYALGEVAFYETFEECPLRLLRCGSRLPPEALEVDDVRCVTVSKSRDRCTFRLTETRAGENGGRPRTVRSRCTGHLTPMGTSHSPWVWGFASWNVPPPSCRSSR